MAKAKYVVAVKINDGRVIKPGQVLGDAKYREKEFAVREIPRLAVKARVSQDQLGIFLNGQLVT